MRQSPLLFCAAAKDASGTFPIWRDVRLESALGCRAEVGLEAGLASADPSICLKQTAVGFD